MPRALPTLLALVMGFALFAPGVRGDTGGEATPRLIDALAAPGEATRRGAVEALVRALPEARPLVVEALADAPPEVQVHLIEILGRDGSPEAIRALLASLRKAEPLQASRIRYALVRHPEAARGVLEAWAADPTLRAPEGEEAAPPVRALEALLRRGQAEELFLARKSRTGGTGSYTGQYDVLLPFREEALEFCIGLLLDRAVEEPGVFTAGRFELLRPPARAVPMDELMGMAAHAFGELGRESDGQALQTLTVELPVMSRRIDALYGEDDFEFLEALGRYTDVLIALYRVRPSHYESFVNRLLRDITFGRWRHFLLTRSMRASILLRIGRYEQAIREFEYLLRRQDMTGLTSRALAYYNMACALAQWGEQQEGIEREQKRRLALEYLERTVQEGWSDTGWLDEDRDLDPIRDTDRFRALRQVIVEANTPPEDE